MSASIEVPTVPWRAFGASVRGASHDVGNAPNQDAVAWTGGDGIARPLVLAVADGHGSPHCFRSDVGSQFAVSAAHDVLGELDAFPDDDAARERLARRIVATWLERVDEHAERTPFRPDERALLAGYDERDGMLLAYGSTLLAVVVRDERVFFAQIGDGDILVTSDDGSTERIFPKDPELASNETHSLCQPDAWREFRFSIADAGDALPALVIASTDGYSNSFATDADYFAIGRDFEVMIRERGIADVHARLAGILDETSRAGSRDDITAGFVTRLASPPAIEPAQQPGDERRNAPSPRSLARAGIATLAALACGAALGCVLALFVPALLRHHPPLRPPWAASSPVSHTHIGGSRP